MRRSSVMSAALALVASLAFVTPSQAGLVFPLDYTYSVVQSGAATINAASLGGGSSTSTVAPSAPGSGSAPEAPAQTDSYVTIASFTQHSTGTGISGTFPNFNVSGGLYSSGSYVTEAVTVTYGGKTGVFDVKVDFSGQFAYTGSLATPAVTSSGAVTIDGVLFQVYEQGSVFNNNTQKSSIKIGIEAYAVPEPTSMALLGLGMTSFLAFRRFFKRTPIA